MENSRHVFDLLLSNTSANENRQTGERSPTDRFVDFEQPEHNRFIAVCQYKVRIPGTEHHIVPDIVLFLNGLPVVVIECKSPKVPYCTAAGSSPAMYGSRPMWSMGAIEVSA